MTSQYPIQNVLVLGATGSVGPSIVKALLAHSQSYKVSILTRPSSLERTRSMFPDPKITIHTVDYSALDIAPHAFAAAFHGQDAIVSATATFTVSQQIAIIDAAIATGTVKRFIPSEYGIDTAESDSLRANVPVAALKTDIIKYLQQHEDSLSWTALCTGAFFDWGFSIPGNMGWNLHQRSALIFDGGDIPYEATNIDKIGVAVAALLSSTPSPGFGDGTGKLGKMLDITRNRYVYVNSFTTTQNKVLGLLEKYTGDVFAVQHVKAVEVGRDGVARSALSVPGFRPTRNLEYADGVAETIFAAFYGNGDLNNFSRTKGLWNRALGLEDEDLEETVERLVRGSR